MRIEFKILAEEYRICLKKILGKVEASISEKLAEDAQENPDLNFVTWKGAGAPSTSFIYAFLEDRKAGFGKDIYLRFELNSGKFHQSFSSRVYRSYEEHFPGDPDKLEETIKSSWTDTLKDSYFRREILQFLKNVPITYEASITPRPSTFVTIPMWKENLQTREGSKLSVLFTPLESRDDAELTLRTLKRSRAEWGNTVAGKVYKFEFPPGNSDERWSERIRTLFQHKDEKSVRVFMIDYHWYLDGTEDNNQTSPY